MDRKCSHAITCPGTDSPGINFSTEYTDGPDFVSLQFPVSNPYDPGIPGWWATACAQVCHSANSAEEALLCAIRMAQTCAWTPQLDSSFPGGLGSLPPPNPPIPPPPRLPPPPPPTFYNSTQTCQRLCPDGTIFTATTPAGTVIATSQSEADAIAYQIACNAAQAQMRYQVIGNDEQTATASCGPAFCPNTVTRTMPADSIQKQTCSRSDAVVAGIKAQLNAQALADAQAEANAALSCKYGNAPISGSATCGPKTYTANIPACTFTSSDISAQRSLDSSAEAALANALKDAKAAGGCACPGPDVVSLSNNIQMHNNTACAITFITNVTAGLHTLLPGGTYDMNQDCINDHGSIPAPGTNAQIVITGYGQPIYHFY